MKRNTVFVALTVVLALLTSIMLPELQAKQLDKKNRHKHTSSHHTKKKYCKKLKNCCPDEGAFIVGTGPDFAPWADVVFLGDIPSGLSVEMINQIAKESCVNVQVVAQPNGDCVTRDQENNVIPGPGLVVDYGLPTQRPGNLDACLDWFATDARKEAGFVFSDIYSGGPASVLISAGDVPNYANAQKIGYKIGFTASPDTCNGLTAQMAPGPLKEWIGYTSDDAGTEQAFQDLQDGVIDLFLWEIFDSVPSLPNGSQPLKVVQDGGTVLPIICSLNGLAILTYPLPENAERIKEFLCKMNFGLDKIRTDSYYETLCYKVCPEPSCILEREKAEKDCLKYRCCKKKQCR